MLALWVLGPEHQEKMGSPNRPLGPFPTRVVVTEYGALGFGKNRISLERNGDLYDDDGCQSGREKLTSREQETLLLVVDGRSDERPGAALDIAVKPCGHRPVEKGE